MNIRSNFHLVILILYILPLCSQAQGPSLDYYYDKATDLPWASCYFVFNNDSKIKTGFFPVINEKTNGLMGSHNYTRDVNLHNLVIYTNLTVIDSFPEGHTTPILRDKILLLHDYPPNTEASPHFQNLLEDKMKYAMENDAVGIVIINRDESYPLYTLTVENEIPIISITQTAATEMFNNAEVKTASLLNSNYKGKNPVLTSLPISLDLNIQGEYKEVETEKFAYHYIPHLFPEEKMDQQIISNEKSVDFLMELFQDLDLKWSKENIYYFPDFTSKIFYTGYWGIGFSTDTGVYNVFAEMNDSKHFGLAVHENTHSLLRKNGMTFSSFFDEGIARYAEAMAVDPQLNVTQAHNYKEANTLYPLEEMLDFKIGNHINETEVAYPASGSFVEFLINKYGKEVIFKLNKEAYHPFTRQELLALEDEWLDWLE